VLWSKMTRKRRAPAQIIVAIRRFRRTLLGGGGQLAHGAAGDGDRRNNVTQRPLPTVRRRRRGGRLCSGPPHRRLFALWASAKPGARRLAVARRFGYQRRRGRWGPGARMDEAPRVGARPFAVLAIASLRRSSWSDTAIGTRSRGVSASVIRGLGRPGRRDRFRPRTAKAASGPGTLAAVPQRGRGRRCAHGSPVGRSRERKSPRRAANAGDVERLGRNGGRFSARRSRTPAATTRRAAYARRV
jgi:hypothetical protein